jgi:hypothetical protein
MRILPFSEGKGVVMVEMTWTLDRDRDGRRVLKASWTSRTPATPLPIAS